MLPEAESKYASTEAPPLMFYVSLKKLLHLRLASPFPSAAFFGSFCLRSRFYSLHITMPKAAKRKSSSSGGASKPSKSPRTKSSFPYPNPPEKDAQSTEKKSLTSKDPKASHLYTDDNPSTTLPGTGFKDASAAQSTLSLVSKRSLIYQFQTINTMFHRAKHHPSRTADIDAAIAVFQTWLKETYPATKDAQREFKPVLGKAVVEELLPRMKKMKGKGVNTTFAEMYVKMEKRKRLANTLVNPEEPGEEDWDVKRMKALDRLVPEGKEFSDEELWEGEDGGGGPTNEHLKLIAWAWSPASERKLKGRMGKGKS